MRALFVAEKNDAAKGIAAILSRGTSTRRDGRSRYNKIYQFKTQVLDDAACIVSMTSVSGHLLQHAFPSAYKNWNETPIGSLFDAPVQKVIISGMEDIKTTLLEEARKTDVLVIWTDCDREGEAIGAEIVAVCRQASTALDVYRAKFSEITTSAVTRALNNLLRLDQRMVDAVECRSELDLRIGAAFTRLQTLHLRNNFANIFRDKNVVSYGSCQFPTLGFIVERYQSIKNFIVENFWKISLKHVRDGVTVDFTWDRQRLFDRNVAQVLLEDCEDADSAQVISVTKKPKSKWRPTALDTVDFEKLAVRKLHLSAKEAMAIAEKLYNKGYISYPRTETNKFPREMDLNTYVQQQVANADWGDFAYQVANRGANPRNGSKTDEAHPPIHPLKFAGPGGLAGQEWAVYEFVVRHFLACVSSDAKGQETKVQVKIGGETFTASGLIIEDYGYLDVYKYEKWGNKALPKYDENEALNDYELQLVEGQTQPPQLLNEADLIALMDKYGIGTDATHAEHIETVKTRQYAILNNEARFVPGYIGLALVDGYDRMGYAMSKPHMRANLETQLKLICQGERTKEDVLLEQVERYRQIFVQAEAKVQLLSQSLKKYLSQRDNEAAAIDSGVPSTNTHFSLRPPPPPASGNTRFMQRVRRTINHGNRGVFRARRNEPEQAETNANDIELLSSLSILHVSDQGSRIRFESNDHSGANFTQRNRNVSNGRICLCSQPAKRLIVKKEGPNKGRYFWICSKDRNDSQRCRYFEWEGTRGNDH